MESRLVISNVDSLQKKMIEIVKTLKDSTGVYISLNRTHEGIEETLKKNKVSSKNIFFIDAVNTQNATKEAIHISPRRLDLITYSIKSFMKVIPGKKFVFLDALSTLLIYNNENTVAEFIQELVEFSKRAEIKVIALSPQTKGEELLTKIYGFFDKVDGKYNG